MRVFAIFLVLVGIGSFAHLAYAYPIHDLDYENSPYDNKKPPSLGKPIDLFYQIGNYGPTQKNSHAIVTITNIDESSQVYYNEYTHVIPSGKTIDIRWSFTPQVSGLYLVEVNEDSGHAKRFFAVPDNDSLKRLPITSPELLDNTSPRKQFRMGIDPKLITCKDDMFLALKTSNLPVCLTLDSVVELRKRGFIQAEVINYDKIGLTLSESKFKSLLEEKNITYESENMLLITGYSDLSLPPSTGYCGYVLDNASEDYWFSSSYAFPTFHNDDLYDENPHPCKPNLGSCGCTLQTKLAEKNLQELSYYDDIQQTTVGNIFKDYLNEGGKISNVPNSFTVGKYNLDIGDDVESFCGQFQGKAYWHFRGKIKDSAVINFSLEVDERPPLCAITDNPIIFTFDESAIVKGN